jgi:hypothetical protein
MSDHKMENTLPDAIRLSIDRMISRSKTKLIAPILTAGILRQCHDRGGKYEFSEQEMREAYHEEVCVTVRQILKHNLNIGGEYEDAYSSRTLPKYGVVTPIGHRRYRLPAPLALRASDVINYIQLCVPDFIAQKLGGVTALQSPTQRMTLAHDPEFFVELLDKEMQRSASHFEIVSFAVLRVHLEKFACKVYRSSKTSAHDSGVDIATDYGAVYQIKKMRLLAKGDAEQIYSEILTNFDEGRIKDRKVVLIIDDISSTCKQFLIDMRVQSLVRADILVLAGLLADEEDRLKVLRVVYDEFEREYRSDVCMACRIRPRIEGCLYIPSAYTISALHKTNEAED